MDTTADESNIHDTTETEIDTFEVVQRSYEALFKQKVLKQLTQFQICPSESVFACEYSENGQYLALACATGLIKIINTTKYQQSSLQDTEIIASPVTGVKWRPNQTNENFKESLLATYSEGKVLYWHATSRQVLYRIHEPENQVNVVEWTKDGKRFVTAGSDAKVRLYDAGKLSHGPSVLHAGENSPTHQNRIFALKFNSQDPNTLYSCGWDNVVLQWDLRVQKSTGFIYGPLVCGDALDHKDNQLLTGSFRDHNQLQIWDTRTLSQIVDIPFHNYVPNKLNNNKIYSACFDQEQSRIYVSTFGKAFSEVRVYEGEGHNYECIDSHIDREGILSIDHSAKHQQICYTLNSGSIGILSVL